MRKILFYFTTVLGIFLLFFGLYSTYETFLECLMYSKLKDTGLMVITKYGTSIWEFEKNVWKMFLLFAVISAIGCSIAYLGDKYLSKKRWVNDEYALITIIMLLMAIPAYYFLVSILDPINSLL